MSPNVTKELIFDHFSGRSTPLQKRLIEEWLQHQPNLELYYQWLLEWEQRYPSYLPVPDKALAGYLRYMESSPPSRDKPNEEAPLPALPRGRRRLRIIAAASFWGMLLLAWSSKEALYYKSYRADFGETLALTLDDGSSITLNANSRLQVPRFSFRTNSSNCEVLLAGEAFFSIISTPDKHPFVVKTPRQMDVTVLGTEFTVFARERGGRVMLKKGSVQLNYNTGNTRRQVLMKPGDLAILDPVNTLELKTNTSPDAYMAFKQKRFVFDNMPLHELCQILTENYGLHFSIATDSLANRTLVGSFKMEDADELLTTLAVLLNIKIEKEDHLIRLMDQD